MDTPLLKKLSIAAAATAVIAVAVVLLRSHDAASTADEKSGADGAARRKIQWRAGASYNIAEWRERISDTAAKDLKSLMEEAMNIADVALRRQVIEGIVDRWLMEDAQGFTKYWAALEVHGADGKLALLAEALQNSLTKLDETRAASDDIYVVVQRLISYLATTDPHRALEWANLWLLNDAKENALVAVARNLAKTDVSLALGVIADMKSPVRRGQAVAGVAIVWASRDMDAALAWAGGLTNPVERGLALNGALLVAAQQDPVLASKSLKDHAQQMNSDYVRERNADMAARGLTEADLAEDSETYKELVANGNVSAPYSADVELMADAGRVLGAKLAESDPAGAVEWAADLETDYLKLKSLSGVLEGWAKTDPYAALAYLNEHFPYNNDLFASLYSSWSTLDSAGAAKGALSINDPYQRSLALETVISNWAIRGNAGDAINFLGQLPAAEVTDGVRAAAATAISQSSPQKAWEIASGISNENAQFRALKTAFSTMVIQNPAEAGSLLASATLPEKTTDRLRDILDAVAGN
jgi:hypothetical protein